MAEQERAIDAGAKGYQAVLEQPWNVLGQWVRTHNLRQHLAPGGHLLDVGGGNGQDARTFAAFGYSVTVLEPSRAMLDEARRLNRGFAHAARIRLVEGGADALDSLLLGGFDAILCHNVLSYLEDEAVPGVLKSFYRLLKPGGVASLLAINRFSEPLRCALQQGGLALALERLESREYVTATFGAPVWMRSAEEVAAWAKEAGLGVACHYGIRVLYDLLPPALQADMAKAKELELALSARYPYYLMARFFQLIVVKEQE